jgi:hypothetical protein
MRWEKRGRIYVPPGNGGWDHWYAFPPIPYLRPDGVLRIYLSFCDPNIVGRLGYVDVDPRDPAEIAAVAQQPLLDIGEPGAFDENGILPLSIVPVADRLLLYFVGYQLGMNVRYYQFTGLAESTDGGETFQRISRAPILDRSDAELLNRTSTFVMREGGVFRMWYVAGSEWTRVGGKSLPIYDLRYLESADGVHWPDAGHVCIELAGDEHAFGRPWVVHTADGYRMFYSIRTRTHGYRVGYAESADGIEWTRMDAKAGIDVSESGWDSEMIAYTSVFHYEGVTTLFFNGNGLGRTGFGHARLVADDHAGGWAPVESGMR